MPEEFYERLYRKLIAQVWLATGVMALLAVVVAVILSRAVSSVDLQQLKSLIESSKCSCKLSSINNSANLQVSSPWSREETIQDLVKSREKEK